MVEEPPVWIKSLPALAKPQVLLPIATVNPLPMVRLFWIWVVPPPVKFRLLPMVTPLRKPPVALNAVPSPLISVPLVMVPLNADSPPAPNCPLLPMSIVPAVLLMVPIRLIKPPLRAIWVAEISVSVKLPPRFSVPLETVRGPVLVQFGAPPFGLMVSVPPLTVTLLALAKELGLMFSVPAVTLTLLLLVK